MNINTLEIECFLTAAQSDNFAQAAEKCFMSRSTFGRHISALERELGFALFTHERSALKLTAAGEEMYQGLKKITGELQTLQAHAADTAAGKYGRLKIALLEGQLIDDRLHQMIASFRDTHPEIELIIVRLSYQEMSRQLFRCELDLAVTLTAEARRWENLQSLPLCTIENELVLPMNHPLAGGQDLSLADFADETFIQIQDDESPAVAQLLLDSCRAAGFTPKIRTVPDLRSQIHAVESGRGIAGFNLFHQLCNYPGLTHVPVAEFPPVEFSAVWLADNPNPALALFLQA